MTLELLTTIALLCNAGTSNTYWLNKCQRNYIKCVEKKGERRHKRSPDYAEYLKQCILEQVYKE